MNNNLKKKKIYEELKDELENYYYKCYRCDYESKNMNDMKRHIERKNICKIDFHKEELDINEWYEESLKKRYKDEDKIIEKYNEKLRLEREIEKLGIKVEENNNKIECEYCEKSFSSKSNKNTHIKHCIIKSIVLKEKKKENKNIDNDNDNTDDDSIKKLEEEEYIKMMNNKKEIIENKKKELIDINKNEKEEYEHYFNIINFLQKNIDYKEEKNNVFLNINKTNIKIKKENEYKVVSFFEDYDVSHIDDQKYIDLVLSNFYIDTLEEILKNPVNINFVYMEMTNEIYVYKNEVDKYVLMENIFVLTNIIKKVKNFLLKGIEKIKEIKPNYHIDHLQIAEYHIKKKYNDYIRGIDIEYIDRFKSEIIRKIKENVKDGLKNFEFVEKKVFINQSV